MRNNWFVERATVKTDWRNAELKYEDDHITHFRLNGNWVADNKGVAQLIFG